MNNETPKMTRRALLAMPLAAVAAPVVAAEILCSVAAPPRVARWFALERRIDLLCGMGRPYHPKIVVLMGEQCDLADAMTHFEVELTERLAGYA